MEPQRITAEQARRAGRRLVLITTGVSGQGLRRPPLRIVGSEPRHGGGFRLTDR